MSNLWTLFVPIVLAARVAINNGLSDISVTTTYWDIAGRSDRNFRSFGAPLARSMMN
jgi:hypothetical protein